MRLTLTVMCLTLTKMGSCFCEVSVLIGKIPEACGRIRSSELEQPSKSETHFFAAPCLKGSPTDSIPCQSP